ncbi:hypothetical protein FOZ63_014940 [Perkinsus olseni]|uniref:Berberine/berberine-like domain-containing protein n=1 Tax=Perkinsus olseni TaxID=32597 RepID=A0A7J6QX85_PEROL|nr:hypothetical protein FOZ63_014940 [Perkinsus olseni]
MLDEPTDCSGAGPCTSFIHRHQGWNVQVSSLWNKGDSAGEETSTNWVAKAFAAIDQFSSLEESYQNYISNQWTVERWKDKFFPGQDVQPDHWKYRYFGPLSNGVYNRLQEVKCHYNPYNLFTTPTTADIAAYMEAKAAYTEDKAAYTEGKAAYTEGKAAYTEGKAAYTEDKAAYTEGKAAYTIAFESKRKLR